MCRANLKLIFLSILFLCSVNLQISIAEETSKRDSVSYKSVPKNALFKSLVMPGWGQWENKRHVKALGFATLSTSLLLYSLDAQVALSETQSPSHHQDLTAMRNTRILLFFLSSALAAIDAYVDAHLADFSKGYTVDSKINGAVLRFYKAF
jgi:hypothetical protein